MNRTDRLVGEVVDVAALAASAFVGWWKFVIKAAIGFVVVAVINGIGQGMHLYGAAKPDAHGYYDGGPVTVLLFGAYGLWVVCMALFALGRGARNLFWHGR
jgi:hypothetical protein